MTDCIFCKIVAGDIPAAKVYEDALTVAFMDIGQVNPGHVLVASKRHAVTVLDLTPMGAGDEPTVLRQGAGLLDRIGL